MFTIDDKARGRTYCFRKCDPSELIQYLHVWMVEFECAAVYNSRCMLAFANHHTTRWAPYHTPPGWILAFEAWCTRWVYADTFTEPLNWYTHRRGVNQYNLFNDEPEAYIQQRLLIKATNNGPHL